MDGVFDHQRSQDLVSVAAEQLEDEGVVPGVLSTGSAPTETARRQRGPFAHPAIHSSAPRDCLPQASVNIMARSGPEITCFFAGRLNHRDKVQAVERRRHQQP
jgi:hypothetical protein